MKLILSLLFIPFYCSAAIDVAFIEIRNYEGKIIQLETNGQFAHVAISYQGNWLHAHPYRGVEIVSKEVLEKTGYIKKSLRFQINPL